MEKKQPFNRIWNGEIPEPSPGFRLIATVIMLTAAFSVPIGLASSLHLLDFLGPALGDSITYQPIINILQSYYHSEHFMLLAAFTASLIIIMSFRGLCVFISYHHYQRHHAQGKAFPLRTFYTFLLFNLLLLLFMAALTTVFGIISMCLGFTFEEGFQLLNKIVSTAHQLTITYIPTLIDLPPLLAIVVIYTLTGFFHYWLHRLAHTFRTMWLLFHRPHHMPDNLVEPIVTGVIVAFPLGFLVMFPYVFFFGACTKLFSAEPLYLEIILINLCVQIGATTAHSTALYSLGFKHKWLGMMGYIFGTAQYHYLHHASQPTYAQHNNNLTNIGGGFCFMWDRLFGTYAEPPTERPSIGLTNNPPLHMNPFRLIMAGLVQLAYELHHNKQWRIRWKIITGTSDYTPPISKDFAIKAT